MFDFPSDGRDEGDRPGINDKGLVTADGGTPKDAFYFLKGRWSQQPVLYIASRRDTPRLAAKTDVTVYTNAQTVVLFLNGVPQGARAAVEGIARWSALTLRAGANVVEAAATFGAIRVSGSLAHRPGLRFGNLRLDGCGTERVDESGVASLGRCAADFLRVVLGPVREAA